MTKLAECNIYGRKKTENIFLFQKNSPYLLNNLCVCVCVYIYIYINKFI